MAQTSPATIAAINPLFRRPVVEQLTGFTRSTIYRNIKRGLFTKPVQIGGDRVAWPSNEVQALINARIAGKTEDQIKTLVIELENAKVGADQAA